MISTGTRPPSCALGGNRGPRCRCRRRRRGRTPPRGREHPPDPAGWTSTRRRRTHRVVDGGGVVEGEGVVVGAGGVFRGVAAEKGLGGGGGGAVEVAGVSGTEKLSAMSSSEASPRGLKSSTRSRRRETRGGGAVGRGRRREGEDRVRIWTRTALHLATSRRASRSSSRLGTVSERGTTFRGRRSVTRAKAHGARAEEGRTCGRATLRATVRERNAKGARIEATDAAQTQAAAIVGYRAGGGVPEPLNAVKTRVAFESRRRGLPCRATCVTAEGGQGNLEAPSEMPSRRGSDRAHSRASRDACDCVRSSQRFPAVS